jgi:hypothetical protein
MSAAAMANDRIDFMESYHKALEAARKVVAGDPTVPMMDKEREAERRVISSWRSRDPLGVLARKPTDMEVRRLLGIMDPDGAADVKEALNRYRTFSRLIVPSEAENKQRAEMRRLVRPPTLANPYRSQAPALF